jgi:uncharacterized protein (UPF0147 family)
MDKGRERDLTVLKKRMHDESLPRPIRQRADKVFYKICQQLKDRRLQALRYQLINAHVNGDAEAGERISELLQDYEYKRFGLPEVG